MRKKTIAIVAVSLLSMVGAATSAWADRFNGVVRGDGATDPKGYAPVLVANGELAMPIDWNFGVRRDKCRQYSQGIYLEGRRVSHPKRELLPQGHWNRKLLVDGRPAGAVLTDCYADTAMTGFWVRNDARIFNCGYFNNWRFKMDNPTVFRHDCGTLIVTGGRFTKTSPNSTLYHRGEKASRLIWRDNQPFNFKPADMKELEDELKKSGATERSTVSDAKMAG